MGDDGQTEPGEEQHEDELLDGVADLLEAERSPDPEQGHIQDQAPLEQALGILFQDSPITSRNCIKLIGDPGNNITIHRGLAIWSQ